MAPGSKKTLRKKAVRFTQLIRESAMQPRVGESLKPLSPQAREMALTFIGHSSFLAELGGQRFLIDPNFAQWLVILKRLRRPGLKMRDLPPIDWVLVTHAHMDHLHKPSLRRIARQTKRGGKAPGIIVPRNVGDLVAPLGFREVIEVDWWDQVEAGGIKITHTPARHWGARVISDTHRGFGGYALEGAGHSLYHAGDTAYFSGFKEIGQRLHPRVALLPIGAYKPESFRNVHASPEDALRGFLEMKAQCMIPMHYGTFRLSQEPMEEPVPRLLIAARKAGVRDCVRVLKEGVTAFFPPSDGDENTAQSCTTSDHHITDVLEDWKDREGPPGSGQ